MERDPNGFLATILEMRNTYASYLNQANEANSQQDHTCNIALGLEQELRIIKNEERAQTVALFEEQSIKLKRYKTLSVNQHSPMSCRRKPTHQGPTYNGLDLISSMLVITGPRYLVNWQKRYRSTHLH